MERDPLDIKRLIRESYRIDGISAPECRSIFLDWALTLTIDQDTQAAIDVMLERYGTDNPDHPMTKVLHDAKAEAETPKRRGGWRSRPRD